MKDAKERLVELLMEFDGPFEFGKESYYYKEFLKSNTKRADAILKEFVRREDIETCDCLYTDLYNLIHIDEQCKSCNGLGWVAIGE